MSSTVSVEAHKYFNTAPVQGRRSGAHESRQGGGVETAVSVAFGRYFDDTSSPTESQRQSARSDVPFSKLSVWRNRKSGRLNRRPGDLSSAVGPAPSAFPQLSDFPDFAFSLYFTSRCWSLLAFCRPVYAVVCTVDGLITMHRDQMHSPTNGQQNVSKGSLWEK